MPKKFKISLDWMILIAIIAAFVIGGLWLIARWQVSRDDWRTNFEKYSIPPELLVDSGIGRNGIQPVDVPRWETVSDAEKWLDERTPVIALLLDDDPRAYPLNVLLRHEVVNDQIGEQAVAVTFCPLCNSAVVYDRRVDDLVLRFGVSGTLYNSGFVMWDSLSESWWMQFTGEAIIGDYTGTVLPIVPSQVVGFASFAERFPDGKVLAGDQRFPGMNYAMTPYAGYDSNQSPMMSTTGAGDPRLKPMDRVLAGLVDDVPVAYAFTSLQQNGVIHDEVDGKPVVVFWMPGAVSVLDQANVSMSRDVGQAALFGREVAGQVLTFEVHYGQITDVQTGSVWNIFGEAVSGELAGSRLQGYTCFPHFWFAWSSAYPETLVRQ